MHDASRIVMCLVLATWPGLQEPAGPVGEPSVREVDEVLLSAETVDREGKIDSWAAWQPVFRSDGRRQDIRYGQRFHEGPGAERFLLLDADARGEVVHGFRASFEILYVATERRDRFFLLGRVERADGSDEFVIERWNARRLPLRGRDEPSGEALPDVAMERTEIYRGTELGALTGVGADPDGRFLLLAAHRPGRVVALSPDGSTEVLFHESEIAHLASVDMLTPTQHRTLGRVWMLEGGARWTLLIDADGDGAFESFETLTAAEWDARHAFSSDWVDDFLGVE